MFILLTMKRFIYILRSIIYKKKKHASCIHFSKQSHINCLVLSTTVFELLLNQMYQCII